MQDYINSNTDDEIDLSELFWSLWAYKFFIAFFCLASVLYSGYFALNSAKIYSSSAIFKLEGSKPVGMDLGVEFSALAGISGFNTNNKSQISDFKVNGRIFIKKMDTILNFQADPYFNHYNSKKIDPIWMSTIKRAFSWPNFSDDTQEAIWQGITKAYSKSITIDQTDDDAIKVKVKHSNAERAAKIANAIMEEIVSDIKNRENSHMDRQLSYLSTKLTNALDDLELAQSNLKAFTLENGPQTLENFAVNLSQLKTLRQQYTRSNDMYEAVSALNIMLKEDKTDHADYLSLRKVYPIVDQLAFRRVLGQNKITASWTWPEINILANVINNLLQRKNKLQFEIEASQAVAERSSRALDEHSRLEREAKIAETTYQVLIDQVKVKSLVAGYQPIRFEIFEYASPSARPSEPKRNLILAIGAILGLFVGSAIALVLATSRGIFFSRKSLVKSVHARFNSSSRTLNTLRNKSLVEINTHVLKKQLPVLRDIIVEIHKNNTDQVVITSSNTKMTANKVALAIALNMKADDMNIAVIDFSNKIKKLSTNIDKATVGSFVVTESVGGVSVLRPEGDKKAIELLHQKQFMKNIQSLNSNFNLTFLCADNDDAISLVRALEGQKIFHLTLAKIKRTKSNTLRIMYSLLPIQGLLHD